MPVRIGPFRVFLVAALAAMLAACGSGRSDEISVAVIGDGDAPVEKGVRLGLPGQILRAATVEGLVAFDEQGRVIPALADRWIVTDDGQSYIFRLRDGTWRDGSDLTARTARRSLQRAIRALRGTSLGLDLRGVEDVREMAGRVIEIRLSRPIPHFLQLLAQPELGLYHDGEGAGPLAVESVEGVSILTPIPPQELGMSEIPDWEERARTIHLQVVPGKKAVELFNSGDVDLVLGGGISDFPHTSSVGILRGTIQLDPVMGLFGLSLTHTDGFLSEPANREAIAMAIDREALIAPFGLDGWSPTTRLVQPGLEGDLGTVGERWPEMTVESRRALAIARIAYWRESQQPARKDGEDDGEGPAKEPITLRVRMPSGPGADMLFERLAADFSAIGLTAERVGTDNAADLELVEDVARYPRASWFLNRLSCTARKGPCSKAADKRMREANATLDAEERAALLAEAEAELTQANIFIPFGPPIRWSLVRGDIDAFATNPWGWHPLMPLALIPK